MMARTHIAFAALSMVACSVVILQRMPQVHEVALAGAAGLLPDLDHPQSTFGRIVPFISIPIAKVFGHRGFTHSLLMVVLIIWLLITYREQQNIPILPLVIGYFSHIIGDMMTPSGVPLLWPIKQKFSLNLFKADGWIERVIYRGCWLGVGYFLWVAFQRPGHAWIYPVQQALLRWCWSAFENSTIMIVQWIRIMA